MGLPFFFKWDLWAYKNIYTHSIRTSRYFEKNFDCDRTNIDLKSSIKEYVYGTCHYVTKDYKDADII